MSEVTPLPDENEASSQMAALLYKVKDAIRRAEDNVADGCLSPTSCAYVDGQLAKAIGWLASCRSIAITQGSLSHPHFDGDELIDLDPSPAILPLPAETGGSAGAA